MKQLIIQIKTHPRSHAVDFQFPGEIPIQGLIPLLVQINGWPQKDDGGAPIFYWFEYQNEPLDDNMTLIGAGIRHGMTVYVKSGAVRPEIIRQEETQTALEASKPPEILKENLIERPEPKPIIVEFEPLVFPQNISVQDRRSQIAPPSEWKLIEDKDIYG